MAEDGQQPLESVLPPKSSQEPEVVDPNHRAERSPTECVQIDTPSKVGESKPQDVTMSDAESPSKSESTKQLFVERTEGYGIPQLERLYTRIMKGVFEIKNSEHRDNLKPSVSSFLLKFAEDEANF